MSSRPELVDRTDGDGYAAVGRTVEQYGSGSAQDLLDALVALGGNGNGEGRLLDDDVTLVVVKRK